MGKISWEFPAQSFGISASHGGVDWSEVFSTSVNMVNVNHIPLNIAATSVRGEMKQAQGTSPVYGIKSLALFAPRLEASLDDCETAAFAYGCQAVTLHANASASTFMLVA